MIRFISNYMQLYFLPDHPGGPKSKPQSRIIIKSYLDLSVIIWLVLNIIRVT